MTTPLAYPDVQVILMPPQVVEVSLEPAEEVLLQVEMAAAAAVVVTPAAATEVSLEPADDVVVLLAEFGLQGVQGDQGTPGVPGVPGVPGPPGAPGAEIVRPQRFYGNGPPQDPIVGSSPGDEYVDGLTGDLYRLE